MRKSTPYREFGVLVLSAIWLLVDLATKFLGL
jgi:hypothetical protein